MDSKQPAVDTADRAAGAIVGALVGNALGVGPHWMYDVEELKAKFGWVDNYTEPLPGRYHHGCLHAGDVTQQGFLYNELLESLADKGTYDEEDFTARWDRMFERCQAVREGGPWGWQQKDMCDVYKLRVLQKKGWANSESASPRGDTTDSMIRAALFAGRYHQNPHEMCMMTQKNSRLQFKDEGVVGHSQAMASALGAIINGDAIDDQLSGKLYKRAQQGILPFSFLAGTRDDEGLPEPDGLLLFSTIFGAAQNPKLLGALDPPALATQIYGPACAYFMCLPSAYYFAGRFPNSFEDAVLHSVNAGGQNVARASLVGALVGANVGLSGIPQRFIDGLKGGARIVQLAKKVAAQGAQEARTQA